MCIRDRYDIIQSRKNCDDWSDFGIRVVDDAPDIIAQFSKLTESVQYALFYPPFVEGCIEACLLYTSRSLPGGAKKCAKMGLRRTAVR